MANQVNDVALVATLSNGRKVLLEPNFTQEKCGYRFLTNEEMTMNKLNVRVRGVWFESPIYSTTEKGELIIFTIIEGNTVVLSRI